MLTPQRSRHCSVHVLVHELAFFIVIGSMSASAQESLFDEIIAAHDATVAAVKQGVASYRVRSIDSGRVSEYVVRVQFAGERIRFDYGDGRNAADNDQEIAFDAPKLGTAEASAPHHYIAIVYDAGKSGRQPWKYHPRYVGHTDSDARPRDTLGETLRLARRIAASDPTYKLIAERDGAAIRITYQRDFLTIRTTIDPRIGYSITHIVTTDSRFRNPAKEVTNEYKTLPGGQIVAARTSLIMRRPDEQTLEYVDRWRTETTLVDIDLEQRPDEEVFTLKGLGVPVGARVSDTRTGKDYLFGIGAVTDEELSKIIEEQELRHLYGPAEEAPTSSWGRVRWTLGIALPAVALLLGVLLFLRARGRASRG